MPSPNFIPSARKMLNAPIKIEELTEAVAAMASSKSPGTDGLPAETYKRYGEFLLLSLLDTLNAALKCGCLPHSMNKAVIVVILKPGKDPQSYRPISLLNTDIKLLARVLATSLVSAVSGLVHLDQSSFIPARSTALNIPRLFLNVQLPVDNPGNRAFFPLGAAKAFDSLEWRYLWAVLRKFQVGSSFLPWVQLLYAAPKARVRMNGALSVAFPLFRGTRQGCPLSPLLFALALEPLAARIRIGFCRGVRKDKLFLYADNTLIYLGDAAASLESVMTLITQFGQYSGFTIKWNRSSLLLLDPLETALPESASQVEVVHSLKYLGIVVTGDSKDYIKLNLKPILQKFKHKCTRWSVLSTVSIFTSS